MSSKLPYDVMSEIAVRLPFKTLVRFQALSKPWAELVRRPRIHGGNLITTAGFLFRPRDPRLYARRSHHYASIDPDCTVRPPDSIPAGALISASCNGLLLLRRPSCARRRVFTVLNPALRTGVVLPPTKHMLDHRHVAAGIAFDASRSPHYKVVEVAQTPAGRLDFQVYSSATNEWTKPASSFQESELMWLAVPAWNVACSARFVYVLPLWHEGKFMAIDVEEGTLAVLDTPATSPDKEADFGRATRFSLFAGGEVLRLFWARANSLQVRERAAGTDAGAPWVVKESVKGPFWRRMMMPEVVQLEGRRVFVWTGEGIVAYDMVDGGWESFEMEDVDDGWDVWSGSWLAPPFSDMIPYTPCLVNLYGFGPLPPRRRACVQAPPAPPPSPA